MKDLEVICGPMFSGKTEELLRRLRRERYAQKKVYLIKHKIDNRYGEEIVTTHDGMHTTESLGLRDLSELRYKRAYHDAQVIGIDEVQFFEHAWDHIKPLLQSIKVIVSGLDLDFRGLPFGDLPILLAQADRVDKLTAICMVCGAEANRTQRLIEGEPAPLDGPLVLVGAQDSYEARCKNCYRAG